MVNDIKSDKLTWTMMFRLDDVRHKQHWNEINGTGPFPFPLPPLNSIITGDWIHGGHSGAVNEAKVVQVILSYNGPNDEEPQNHCQVEIYARRLDAPAQRTRDD